VLWTNSSGTEVIGNWNPEVTVSSKNFQGPATSVTNHYAFIGGGQVMPFTWNPGPRGAAW
jgi:hypothetical protein